MGEFKPQEQLCLMWLLADWLDCKIKCIKKCFKAACLRCRDFESGAGLWWKTKLQNFWSIFWLRASFIGQTPHQRKLLQMQPRRYTLDLLLRLLPGPVK